MNDTRHTILECARFCVERVVRTARDGSQHTREFVRHPGAVVILPLIAPDRVCLIKNYRPAVQRTLLELPAGTREQDEAPIATAKRELVEETGYRAGSMTHLQDIFPSPGIMDECMNIFVATELEAGPARREITEEIENHEVSWEQAMRMVGNGEIQDAKTIVALSLWNLRR